MCEVAHFTSTSLLQANPQKSLLAQVLALTFSRENYNPIPAKEMKLQGVHLSISSSVQAL